MYILFLLAHADTIEKSNLFSFFIFFFTGTDGVSPKDVAQHLARFTGLWDVHVDSKIVQGQLYAPSRLPMAVPNMHFFSDIDGRSDYAVMGTPGGDVGEFALACCSLERAREDLPPSSRYYHKALTLPDVRGLLSGWINKIAEKHQYFFMQTDRTSLARLEAAIVMPHFLARNYTSMDRKTKQLVVDLSVLPEHVGSTHLRLMLTEGKEYVYIYVYIYMLFSILFVFFHS